MLNLDLFLTDALQSHKEHQDMLKVWCSSGANTLFSLKLLVQMDKNDTIYGVI